MLIKNNHHYFGSVTPWREYALRIADNYQALVWHNLFAGITQEFLSFGRISNIILQFDDCQQRC